MRDRERKLSNLCRAAREARMTVVTVPIPELEDLIRENASLRDFAARARQQVATVVGSGRDGDN